MIVRSFKKGSNNPVEPLYVKMYNFIRESIVLFLFSMLFMYIICIENNILFVYKDFFIKTGYIVKRIREPLKSVTF